MDEEYEKKLEAMRDEVIVLKENYLATEEGMRTEEELQMLLADRKSLMEELVAALKANGKAGPLVAFSGTCKVSLARIPLSSFETYTLVIPAYDLVGPPPLLQCSIHANLTELDEVIVVVELKNVQHIPDFARGGVQVSMWFEGQTSSRVTTPITECTDGNPHFNFKQSYLFGPITEDGSTAAESDVSVCPTLPIATSTLQLLRMVLGAHAHSSQRLSDDLRSSLFLFVIVHRSKRNIHHRQCHQFHSPPYPPFQH
eukprot:gene2319-1455_t